MNILLATDGTKYCEAAVEMLGKFNLSDGDTIHIVSVVDISVPLAVDIYGGYLPDTTELEKTAREGAATIVETTTATLRGFYGDKKVDITSDILFGTADSCIVEKAEDLAVDLVVLGCHGYKQWERLLLGSVSDSVVHHAPCSVLVVRTAAA